MLETIEHTAETSTRSVGIWKLIGTLLVLWVVLNRGIPDVYVLPVGMSVRPSQAVLVIVAILLVFAVLADPQPWPRGLPAAAGLLLIVALTFAPFRLSLGFSDFQIDGAERAMLLLVIYTGLFLAGYWVAHWERPGTTILKVVVALSTWQALLAFYEWRAGTDLVASWGIWSMIGLGTDSVQRGGNLRASGLFRPSTTTPHPIVLSGLIATAIAVAAILYLREKRPKSRRRMLMAMAPLAVGLLVVNARTGFVVLVVVVLAIVASQLRRLPRFLPLAVASMMAFTVGGILSPDAVRSSLNLFWNASEDNSVNVRVDRLADLPDLISQEPVLGGGWLTNDPKVYLFDNAYTHALLELGILGTALLLLFLLSSAGRMIAARRHGTEWERSLMLVGLVGAFGLLSGAATFDALHFDQFLPTCLLLIAMGLSGADQAIRRVRGGGEMPVASPPPGGHPCR